MRDYEPSRHDPGPPSAMKRLVYESFEEILVNGGR